jgi:metal-sulfur cluster biosynthetic enzyme
MATAADVFDKLRPLIEPELGVPMLELGLIYGVEIRNEGRKAHVRMTLTSPMCPIAPYLIEMVRTAAMETDGLEDASVEIVWDPPWDPWTMATDDARAALGLE